MGSFYEHEWARLGKVNGTGRSEAYASVRNWVPGIAGSQVLGT